MGHGWVAPLRAPLIIVIVVSGWAPLGEKAGALVN
jgi:hypothetical protein